MGGLVPTLVIFLLLLPLSAQAQTKVDTLTQVKNAGADMPYVGPNPWYDVRSFGARMVIKPPSTTATIYSGSAVATLAVASTFKNGDGVVVRGAGPTPTMSTPSGPTVTPSNASTTTGTGVFVANASGATTYQYQVAAVDVLRGVTIASSGTSISNGPATLGSQTVNISSWTRTNNVVRVTTTSAHNLVIGAGFSVTGDATLAGTYNIATVPDNTHFTFFTGLDTRNGALTVGGNSGIVTYYLANHISIAHVAGAQMYLIYGRAAGSMTPTRRNASRFNFDERPALQHLGRLRIAHDQHRFGRLGSDDATGRCEKRRLGNHHRLRCGHQNSQAGQYRIQHRDHAELPF